MERERFKVINCLGVNKAGNQQFKYSCLKCGREYTRGYYFRRNGLCSCMKSKKKPIKKVRVAEKTQDIKQPQKKIIKKEEAGRPCHLDTTPRQLRGLLSAVLFSAIKDARKTSLQGDVLYFLNTLYCQEICDFCNIPYDTYKNRVLREISKYQKRS